MQIKSWQLLLIAFFLQVIALIIFLPEYYKNAGCWIQAQLLNQGFQYCKNAFTEIKEANFIIILISFISILFFKKINWIKTSISISIILGIIEICLGFLIIYINSIDGLLYLLSGIFLIISIYFWKKV